MKTPSLNIDNSIYFGFERFKKNLKFSLVVSLIYGLFIATSLITEYFLGPKTLTYNPTIYYTISIIASLINLYISIGLTKECLKIVDNKKAELKGLFQHSVMRFVKYILLILSAMILCLLGLAVVGGLTALSMVTIVNYNEILGAILIIPALVAMIYGIYLFISFSFIRYTFLDQDLSILDTYKRSYKLTHKQKFSVVGFSLAKGLVFAAGMLLLGVGLVIAFPVVAIATAHFYRSLYEKAVI
jgi:hypothetical protein